MLSHDQVLVELLLKNEKALAIPPPPPFLIRLEEEEDEWEE